MVYQDNTLFERIWCKSRYGFRMSLTTKRYLVDKLCPQIIAQNNTRIPDLEFILDNNIRCRRHNNKYVCVLGERQVIFDEEPTRELLDKYIQELQSYTRHIAAVEDLLKEILHVSRDNNPFRQVKAFRTKVTVVEQPPLLVQGRWVKQPPKIYERVDKHEQPPCKNCGNRDYHDCTTHYTCKKCAVVRDKIHQGLAYREMRDRRIDLNCRSMQVSNIYSESFHRRSDVRMAYARDKKPFSKRDFRKLQLMNERMNTGDKQMKMDTQMFATLEEMENVCAPLHCTDGVIRKAHVLYCQYRKSVGVLRNNNAVICACLFHALSSGVPAITIDEVKNVQRKRKPTPVEEQPRVKQRRLKYVNFKKPFERRKRSHSLSVRLKEKRLLKKKSSSFG
jgi:hypothetical protein